MIRSASIYAEGVKLQSPGVAQRTLGNHLKNQPTLKGLHYKTRRWM
jgi:hypothetical protein